LPPLLTSLFGYLAVAGLYGLSRYWQEKYSHLAKIMFAGVLLLFYFATLRLHFFTANPVVTNKIIGVALVFIVLGINLYLSILRKSETLSGIVLILCFTTALIIDSSHVVLTLIVVTSAISVYLFVKYEWQALLLLSLILAFSTHLIWLFNNPILGHPLRAVPDHAFNLGYLVAYGTIYALALLFKRNEEKSFEFLEIMLTLFNGMGIFIIGGINVLNYFQPLLPLLGFLTFILFLFFAIINWQVLKHNYITSYYACFAYIALSVAIFAQFSSPDYFIYLGLQSLLVIITAIWFRSRIIIVANILIYLGIYCAYLLMVSSNDLVNLSYAITALASARILNWKKERLTLKTDLIRNIYLVCAFIIVLYGLSHAVPQNYVSLSWLGAAFFYFGMSLLLRNIKYRWMAILTIFAIVLRVFLIDTARLNEGLRIIMFIVIGIFIVILSLLYTKYRTKLTESDK